MLTFNTRIILKTFNGTAVSPEPVPHGENYWLLVGRAGRIVDERNRNGRALVLFDDPVSSAGLHCHNPLANSLYILESDLEAHEAER